MNKHEDRQADIHTRRKTDRQACSHIYTLMRHSSKKGDCIGDAGAGQGAQSPGRLETRLGQLTKICLKDSQKCFYFLPTFPPGFNIQKYHKKCK